MSEYYIQEDNLGFDLASEKPLPIGQEPLQNPEAPERPAKHGGYVYDTKKGDWEKGRQQGRRWTMAPRDKDLVTYLTLVRVRKNMATLRQQIVDGLDFILEGEIRLAQTMNKNQRIDPEAPKGDLPGTREGFVTVPKISRDDRSRWEKFWGRNESKSAAGIKGRIVHRKSVGPGKIKNAELRQFSLQGVPFVFAFDHKNKLIDLYFPIDPYTPSLIVYKTNITESFIKEMDEIINEEIDPGSNAYFKTRYRIPLAIAQSDDALSIVMRHYVPVTERMLKSISNQIVAWVIKKYDKPDFRLGNIRAESKSFDISKDLIKQPYLWMNQMAPYGSAGEGEAPDIGKYHDIQQLLAARHQNVDKPTVPRGWLPQTPRDTHPSTVAPTSSKYKTGIGPTGKRYNKWYRKYEHEDLGEQGAVNVDNVVPQDSKELDDQTKIQYRNRALEKMKKAFSGQFDQEFAVLENPKYDIEHRKNALNQIVKRASKKGDTALINELTKQANFVGKPMGIYYISDYDDIVSNGGIYQVATERISTDESRVLIPAAIDIHRGKVHSGCTPIIRTNWRGEGGSSLFISQMWGIKALDELYTNFGLDDKADEVISEINSIRLSGDIKQQAIDFCTLIRILLDAASGSRDMTIAVGKATPRIKALFEAHGIDLDSVNYIDTEAALTSGAIDYADRSGSIRQLDIPDFGVKVLFNGVAINDNLVVPPVMWVSEEWYSRTVEKSVGKKVQAGVDELLGDLEVEPEPKPEPKKPSRNLPGGELKKTEEPDLSKMIDKGMETPEEVPEPEPEAAPEPTPEEPEEEPDFFGNIDKELEDFDMIDVSDPQKVYAQAVELAKAAQAAGKEITPDTFAELKLGEADLGKVLEQLADDGYIETGEGEISSTDEVRLRVRLHDYIREHGKLNINEFAREEGISKEEALALADIAGISNDDLEL